MKRTFTTTMVATLMLLGAGAAFAGGEKCQKAAAAKQAGYASDCDKSAEECLSAMAAKIRSKGWLGIDTGKTADGRYEVVRVEAGSPAEAAGFRAGDVLLAVNGLDLYAADKSELAKAKADFAIGSEVGYKVECDGSKQLLEATLAEVPPRIMAQWIGQHMLDQHSHIEVAAG